MLRENRRCFGRVALVLLACVVHSASVFGEGEQGSGRAFDARAEIEALKAEIARLKEEDERDWLSRRRAEEVRALVREVISDANSRASLAGNGFVAGYDDGFFLASPEETFYLELAGKVQVRYIYNNRRNSGEDDHQAGFTIRRPRFNPGGYISVGERRINFDITINGGRGRNDPTMFQDYYVTTALTDAVDIRAGRFKQPFSLQNIRSSSRQLAVDRSVVNNIFALNRSEGVMLRYAGERLRMYGAVNDGRGGVQTDFDEDNVDVGLTGRAEALLAGDWDQFADASSWSDEGPGAMLGAAIDYDVGETGTDTIEPGPDGTLGTPDDVNIPNNDSVLVWTADLSAQRSGFGVLIAGYGQHTDNEDGPNFDDFGFFAEAGYMIVPDTLEPYVRYGMIFADEDRPVVQDGSLDGQTRLVTAGINWYQARHDSKFTLDAVYALDPLFVSDRGPGARPRAIGSGALGLVSDAAGEPGQFVIRAQYQLKW